VIHAVLILLLLRFVLLPLAHVLDTALFLRTLEKNRRQRP